MPTNIQMLEYEMRDRLAAKNVEIDRLRGQRDAMKLALQKIIALPPGSKGAYSKFVNAQLIARLAVGGMEE